MRARHSQCSKFPYITNILCCPKSLCVKSKLVPIPRHTYLPILPLLIPASGALFAHHVCVVETGPSGTLSMSDIYVLMCDWQLLEWWCGTESSMYRTLGLWLSNEWSCCTLMSELYHASGSSWFFVPLMASAATVAIPRPSTPWYSLTPLAVCCCQFFIHKYSLV